MGADLLTLTSADYTTSGVTDPIAVGPLTTLAVDVDVTAASGTSPSLALFIERQGTDGNWYPIWSPTAVTAAGVVSDSIGPGCSTAAVITSTIRFRWAVTGTTPSFTLSASIVGR
jgi:hypothetical protein